MFLKSTFLCSLRSKSCPSPNICVTFDKSSLLEKLQQHSASSQTLSSLVENFTLLWQSSHSFLSPVNVYRTGKSILWGQILVKMYFYVIVSYPWGSTKIPWLVNPAKPGLHSSASLTNNKWQEVNCIIRGSLTRWYCIIITLHPLCQHNNIFKSSWKS